MTKLLFALTFAAVSLMQATSPCNSTTLPTAVDSVTGTIQYPGTYLIPLSVSGSGCLLTMKCTITQASPNVLAAQAFVNVDNNVTSYYIYYGATTFYNSQTPTTDATFAVAPDAFPTGGDGSHVGDYFYLDIGREFTSVAAIAIGPIGQGGNLSPLGLKCVSRRR